MDQTVQIRFSGGGEFQARLLNAEAPETCAKFWDALPFEGKALHGLFTGFTLFSFVEFKVEKIENPFFVGAGPGDLLLNTYANKCLARGKPMHEEIVLPYSTTGVFWNWGGPLPSNYFGKIQDNLDSLYRIGRRIAGNGSETIFFSKP